MPSLTVTTHWVNSDPSTGSMDSASHGSTVPSALNTARDSMKVEPTKLPASAHWLMAGFQPSVSAGTAKTSWPPGWGGSSGSSSLARSAPAGTESAVDPSSLLLAQPAVSTASASTTASTAHGVRRPVRRVPITPPLQGVGAPCPPPASRPPRRP